jgi:hypothetical protein
MYSPSQGWIATDRDKTGGVRALQWDGGASYAIHGKSRRQLPPLNLSGLLARTEKPPIFQFHLLADGYSRDDIWLPVWFQYDLLSVDGKDKKYRRLGNEWM